MNQYFANCLPEFERIADFFVHQGAQCVRWLAGGLVIGLYPHYSQPQGDCLEVLSSPDLSLEVYGISGEVLQEAIRTAAGLLSRLVETEREMEGMTAALVETQDRLVAIYEFSSATRSAMDIPGLLEVVTCELYRLFQHKGCFIILRETDQPALIRQCSPDILADQEIVALADQFQESTRRSIPPAPTFISLRNRQFMLVVLPLNTDVFAMVGVYEDNYQFTSPDIKLAKTIAELTSAQLEKSLRLQKTLERTRIEVELSMVRAVQTALLPQSLPEIPGLDVYACSLPAYEAGGDFYDLLTTRHHPCIILIGDVTGKGLPAALLMGMIRAIARSGAQNMPFKYPHELMKRLNFDLLDDLSRVEMFATAFIGIYDPQTHRLDYCNAGQSPILYVPINGEPQMLEAQDIPLGILDESDFHTETLILAPGDLFVASTDGLPEATNVSGEMFGYIRLKEILAESRTGTSKEVVKCLMEAVDAFTGKLIQDDDRTIMVVKVLRPPAQVEIEIQASFQAMRRVDEALRNFLGSFGAPGLVIDDCELALHELVTNLIVHACHGDETQAITVRMAVENDTLLVETIDQGEPAQVNLKAVEMPDPDDLAEGGYGLAIIQALVDSLEHRYENAQNIWTLRKKIR